MVLFLLFTMPCRSHCSVNCQRQIFSLTTVPFSALRKASKHFLAQKWRAVCWWNAAWSPIIWFPCKITLQLTKTACLLNLGTCLDLQTAGCIVCLTLSSSHFHLSFVDACLFWQHVYSGSMSGRSIFVPFNFWEKSFQQHAMKKKPV